MVSFILILVDYYSFYVDTTWIMEVIYFHFYRTFGQLKWQLEKAVGTQPVKESSKPYSAPGAF